MTSINIWCKRSKDNLTLTSYLSYCGTVSEEDKLSFFSGLLQEIYVRRDDVCVWKQL